MNRPSQQQPLQDPESPLWFVIPTFNRLAFTRQCLASLTRQGRRAFRVIVVDDGSADGTADMIRREFPETIVLEGDGNLWWAEATNLGIRYVLAQTEDPGPVVCLNDDTLLPADFVEKLRRAAAEHPGAIVSAMATDAATGAVVSAGERMNWWLAAPRALAASPAAVEEVTHAQGRGLLIPLDVFRSVGLFDSRRFPQYAADYDFTHRAHRAGFRIVCDRRVQLAAFPQASGDAQNLARRSWANYRRHLFHRRGGGNLAVFVRYALRNCPWYALPVCLAVGLLRRLLGYLWSWLREPKPRQSEAAQPRVALVTNLITHYRVGMLEALASLCDLECYLHSDGGERFWAREHGVSHSSRLRHHYLAGFRIAGARIVPGLIAALLRPRRDVYIKCINDKFALPVTWLAARWHGAPFILWTGVWMRLATPAQRLLLPLTLRLYRNADAIVAYGEHVRLYLIGEGVDPRRVFLAPQAIDNAAYRKAPTAAQLDSIRAHCGGLAADARVILYVGRLEPMKGLEYLLEAFAQLPGEASLRLLLCGSGSHEAPLRRLAGRLGLAHRVCFAGYVPVTQTPAYYSLAWATVLPSIETPEGRETWGLVVNEAFN